MQQRPPEATISRDGRAKMEAVSKAAAHEDNFFVLVIPSSFTEGRIGEGPEPRREPPGSNVV